MRIKPYFLPALVAMLATPLSALAGTLLVYAAQTEPAGAFALYWTDNPGQATPLVVQGLLGGNMNVLEYDFVPRDSSVIYRANQPPAGPVELYLGGTIAPVAGRKISLPLPSGGSVTHYALSSNSSSIAYIADGATAGVFEVYATDLDGALAVQKVNATPVSGGNVLNVDVSPDGHWMAYRGDLLQDGKFEVFASAIPTTSSWRINMDLADDEDVANFAFSPDSARLAFLVNQSDGMGGLRHRLFAQASDGAGDLTPIADTGSGIGNIVDYQYAPSGSQVALLEDRDVAGQFELYSTNADGSGGTVKISSVMAPDKDVHVFAFSPDGQWLAYTSNLTGPAAAQGELFLYSLAAQGPAVKVNQNPLGSVGLFAFSADSRRLVYQQTQSGASRFDLYERPTNLANVEHQINIRAIPEESIDSFAIGADSRHVAYIGVQALTGNLYLSHLDTGSIARRVNPDGQSVAAILAAPVAGRSAADGGWMRYR